MLDYLKLRQELDLLSKEYFQLEQKLRQVLANELEVKRLEQKKAALKKQIEYIRNKLNPDIIA